jgi:hypothetical protein
VSVFSGYAAFSYSVPKPTRKFLEGQDHYADRVAEWQKNKDAAYAKYMKAKEAYEASQSAQERASLKAQADSEAAKSQAAAQASKQKAAEYSAAAKASKEAGKAAPSIEKQTAAETALESVKNAMSTEEVSSLKDAGIDIAAAAIGGGLGALVAGPFGFVLGSGVGYFLSEKIKEKV